MVVVPFNFGGLGKKDSDYSTSRFAVIPIPYEKTTTYVKGTARGPDAIIDASRNMELYDEELDSTPAEAGITTTKPIKTKKPPETMVKEVKQTCLRVLKDGKFPVVLGGEHSISVGLAMALKESYGKISVLQFDAHADLRESYEGSKYSHACAMKRIMEHADTVQAGIRSFSDEEAELAKKLRQEKKLFFAQDMLEHDCSESIIGGLGDNVFVTFDVDVLDPSIMPSTGTPEPGGLGWYDTLKVMKKVAEKRNIVGFDVVELCPNPENKSPDFTAAKLAYKMMGYVNQTFILKKVQ